MTRLIAVPVPLILVLSSFFTTAFGRFQPDVASGCHVHCATGDKKAIIVSIGFNLPTGIAVGKSGNLFVADNGSRIRKLTSKGKILATFGGPGSGPGQFNMPNLMALDSHGNLYVSDSRNNRVQKLSNKGAPVAQWGTLGTGPDQFDRLQGLTVDSHGNIYVADTLNNRVQKLSPGGQAETSWGVGLVLHHPSGLAIDSHGNIFMSDTGNNRVIKVSPDGHVISWGHGLNLFRPTGIAVDRAGNVYVADRADDHVEKISNKGTLLATWGTAGSGPKDFAFRSQNDMNGVAVDGHGNVWVADTFNNRVKELSRQGATIAIWK